MHPYLVKIGSFKIPAYGVFVSIGFLLAVILAGWRAPQEGIKKEEIYDLSFYVLLGGIVGARLYYVLQHIDEFAKAPWEALFVWRGGLAIIGGLALGALSGVWYCKRRGLDVRKTFDLVAWVLPLAQAIGRIGCLCAGCCYGKPCSLPWAIVFKDPNSLAPIGIPLHPTELYHMVANLIVFAILTFAYKRKAFDGQIVSLYLLLYSVGRFTVEFFRGDNRGFIGPLSLPQWLSLAMFAVGLALYLSLSRRKG